MEVLFVLGPFVVLGVIVLFIAFSGSPAAARQAYLSRGGRMFSTSMIVLYIALGIAVPAAVIAARGEAEGGVGSLRTEKASRESEEGRELFIANCETCHDLDAVQARGVTGPDLDDLGGLDRQRVLNAIRRGGTGQNRMPAGLLQGRDAQEVARYVAEVAGR